VNYNWQRFYRKNAERAIYLKPLKVNYNWQRFYRKNAEHFSEHFSKTFAWKLLTVTDKSSKNKMILLSYDVNDHVYPNLASYGFSQYRSYTDFDKI